MMPDLPNHVSSGYFTISYFEVCYESEVIFRTASVDKAADAFFKKLDEILPQEDAYLFLSIERYDLVEYWWCKLLNSLRLFPEMLAKRETVLWSKKKNQFIF